MANSEHKKVEIKKGFLFNDSATTKTYTLSLHAALPISSRARSMAIAQGPPRGRTLVGVFAALALHLIGATGGGRSEEHTSELQPRQYLVCRFLIEKRRYTRIWSR